MVDRERVVAVLKRRFPGAAAEQIAAATNAIVGLEDEWIELSTLPGNRDGQRPVPCGAGCYLADVVCGGGRFRVFTRVERNDHES